MWMHGWCCHVADLRSTSWTLGPSRKLMYTSRRPPWRYAKSRSRPSNSCAWKRPWALRGPNPGSPCGHQALHPSCGGPARLTWMPCHCTNPYQGHHWCSEQWSLCRHLAEESHQLGTYGPEFGLPGCGWMATTCPALAAGLWVRPVCRDLLCHAEGQPHVPQRLEQWNVCRPVCGWEHAVVLGPDAWRQGLCGLTIPQTSGHRESQSDIHLAPAGDHHTDSLCPVTSAGPQERALGS